MRHQICPEKSLLGSQIKKIRSIRYLNGCLGGSNEMANEDVRDVRYPAYADLDSDRVRWRAEAC